jgi:hypothetical protein
MMNQKKAMLLAGVIVSFSGSMVTNDITISMNVENVAMNPFTFEPILKSTLRSNIPQEDDEQEEETDSSETSEPVVIDSGTLA